MAGIFNESKYEEASKKALDFVKRQLNVNNYTVFPTMNETYASDYTGRIIAHVDMPADAKVNFPNYICCDEFYDETYIGVCSGKHQNTAPATKNLGVEISIFTDQKYRSNVCPLHNDGTWRSEMYYKETDYYGVDGEVTRTITYWYRKDVTMNAKGTNGLKGFELKYYKWLDEDGSEVDVDNLPPTQVVGEVVAGAKFMYAKTYTLRPQLMDDTIIDDALPRYADFDTSLYVFADVEYLTETQNIVYDGVVSLSDLPSNPPVLSYEPEPFIKDSFVQPYTTENKLIITWITNFSDPCELQFNGTHQTVESSAVVAGYYTYHGVVDAQMGGQYTYTINGKGISVSKSFNYVNNNRYLLAGDPQIIASDSAETWYRVQNILNPLPTLIISMGDQVDAITDALTRTEQYSMFTAQHSVPVATVRGNHDKTKDYFGHFGLPNANDANHYFMHNGILFISIDTNSSSCSTHKAFIQTALASCTYKWAILLMHHSLYSTSQAVKTEHTTTLREGLTNFIVNETDIAFVLAGHEHFFCRTNYPGKLFYTVPTCTGSKYVTADYQEAEWNEVTVDMKTPMYTVMDVNDVEIVLTTYDLDNNVIDTYTVSGGA